LTHSHAEHKEEPNADVENVGAPRREIRLLSVDDEEERLHD